jgi:hypothetical protein
MHTQIPSMLNSLKYTWKDMGSKRIDENLNGDWIGQDLKIVASDDPTPPILVVSDDLKRHWKIKDTVRWNNTLSAVHLRSYGFATVSFGLQLLQHWVNRRSEQQFIWCPHLNHIETHQGFFFITRWIDTLVVTQRFIWRLCLNHTETHRVDGLQHRINWQCVRV